MNEDSSSDNICIYVSRYVSMYVCMYEMTLRILNTYQASTWLIASRHRGHLGRPLRQRTLLPK